MQLAVKRLFRAVGLVAMVALTASCTTLLNASVPRDGYRIIDDIPYGTSPRQTLTLYVPDNRETPADVLIFFYGGSWQMGDKADYRFFGEAFASLGYVVVVANYRLYPEVYFPDFMEDAAAATVWTHQNIAHYGGNADNIFVSGHSAGAYMAMMLTLNPQYLTQAGGDMRWIRGALGLAGPYDFLPFTDANIIAIFSRNPARETQPITYATHRSAPIFLATGGADTTVSETNSVNLAAALTRHDTAVTLTRYADVGHIGIVLSLARGFRDKAPLRADMDAFMRAHRHAENDEKR